MTYVKKIIEIYLKLYKYIKKHKQIKKKNAKGTTLVQPMDIN
jgi:hypothetical protein